MHDWRERGYVADSDEEEITSNESQTRVAQVGSNPDGSHAAHTDHDSIRTLEEAIFSLGSNDGVEEQGGGSVWSQGKQELAVSRQESDKENQPLSGPSDGYHQTTDNIWAGRTTKRTVRTYGRRQQQVPHLERQAAHPRKSDVNADPLFSSSPPVKTSQSGNEQRDDRTEADTLEEGPRTYDDVLATTPGLELSLIHI